MISSQPSLAINYRISVAPRAERRILHRWLYWEPFAIRHARNRYPHLALNEILPKLKAEHRERSIDCLTQGLRWTSIVNAKLDDPTTPKEEFRRNMKDAVIRRSKHASK